MHMNVLVTGGAGFIGSHIVDRCVHEGHEVSVIDDLSTGKKSNLNRSAAFYKMDIGSSRVERAFRKERPVVLVHMAAQMNVRRSTEDPRFDAQVNIMGTINLLEHAVKHGVRKVIFASSGGTVYGEQQVFPAPESHPLQPLSPYGISKLSCEYYLKYFECVAGIKPVALRFANVYGPRQNPEGEAGVVAIFTQKMLQGEQPLINGTGMQTRDYVYIGDVLEAVMRCMNSEATGIYNVGTGQETTVNAIFAELTALTKSTCKELHGPAKKGELERSVLDASKLCKETGWEAVVSLADGLSETVQFFREQPK